MTTEADRNTVQHEADLGGAWLPETHEEQLVILKSPLLEEEL